MTGVSMGVQTELSVAFETVWGTAADSGYRLVKYLKNSLGVTQNIEKIAVLGVGRGREGNEVNMGAITDTGAVEVPLDASDLGFWCKGLFGNPATSVGYHSGVGGITFASQPVNLSTITINGKTWTFVTGTPAANQTQISSVNLAGTLTALVNDLTTFAATGNAGTNPLFQFTFSASTTKLTFNTPSSTGANANSIAYSTSTSPASNGTVDAAKMTGGTHKHTFNSGADTLPSFTAVVAHIKVPTYATHVGVQVDSWSQTIDPKSPHGNVTLNLIGKNATWSGTYGGAPDAATARREDEFLTFGCAATKNGAAFGNILSATINMANNLSPDRCLGDAGSISDLVPGIFDANGTMKIRFTDSTLITNATDTTPIAIAFMWNDVNNVGGLNAFRLLMSEVYLSMPKAAIDGPGGLSCDFTWNARSLLQYSVTAILVNQYVYS